MDHFFQYPSPHPRVAGTSRVVHFGILYLGVLASLIVLTLTL